MKQPVAPIIPAHGSHNTHHGRFGHAPRSRTGQAPGSVNIGGQPCHLTFAIPDHSWADSGNGAALRIAMIEWVLATGVALEDRPRYNKTRCFETFPFPDKSTGLTPELRQRTASLA